MGIRMALTKQDEIILGFIYDEFQSSVAERHFTMVGELSLKVFYKTTGYDVVKIGSEEYGLFFKRIQEIMVFLKIIGLFEEQVLPDKKILYGKSAKMLSIDSRKSFVKCVRKGAKTDDGKERRVNNLQWFAMAIIAILTIVIPLMCSREDNVIVVPVRNLSGSQQSDQGGISTPKNDSSPSHKAEIIKPISDSTHTQITKEPTKKVHP